MGQKVHPIGFRVGITKKYQSEWFARFHKYNYAQSLLEDHMLRTTLMKIFPDLLNPVLSKKQKPDALSADGTKQNDLVSKITQIKIQRSLIPFQIDIQIYAENSDLIKNAIQNLKINTDLFCYVEKTRLYLLKLKQQITSSNLKPQMEAQLEGVGVNQSKGTELNQLNMATDLSSLESKENAWSSELKTNNYDGVSEKKQKAIDQKTAELDNLTSNFGVSLDHKQQQSFASFASFAKNTMELNPGVLKEGHNSKKLQTISLLIKNKKYTVYKYKPKLKKNINGLKVGSNHKSLKTTNDLTLLTQPKGLFSYKEGKLGQKKIWSKQDKFSSTSPNKFQFNKNRNKASFSFGRSDSSQKGFLQNQNLINKVVSTKKRLVQRRLQKRQVIAARYANLLSKGLIIKKSNKNVVSLLSTSSNKNTNVLFESLDDLSGNQNKKITKVTKSKGTTYSNLSNSASTASSESESESEEKRFSLNASYTTTGLKNSVKISYTGIKKKFLNVFIKKTNKNFLQHLKQLMSYWHNQNLQNIPTQTISSQGEKSKENNASFSSNQKFSPLGYGHQYNMMRLKQFKVMPIAKLNRLIQILEQKSLTTMEKLRQHYIAFGFLSKTQALSYYQIITFLKNLKKLVSQLSQQKNNLMLFVSGQKTLHQKQGINKNTFIGSNQAFSSIKKNSICWFADNNIQSQWATHQRNSGSFSLNLKGLRQSENLNDAISLDSSSDMSKITSIKNAKSANLVTTLNNVINQCTKIKFIHYLQRLVQTHRQQNLFFYLRTIADARKDLKNFKKFTKIHSKFLFGLDLTNPMVGVNHNQQNQQDKIKQRVTRVLTQQQSIANKTTLSGLQAEKTLQLQKSFLNQIQKQKQMSLQNINLLPKISIKFFSIKSAKNLECKASVVADSIIDALEKRKAFRKVIKDAKQSLMRISKVKGVKIQVAGRLNGAEIARTEWVRAGRVPLQTLRANIDYCSSPANTIYGIIGVKVWIFKGYSKML